jgi:hypothetical protein
MGQIALAVTRPRDAVPWVCVLALSSGAIACKSGARTHPPDAAMVGSAQESARAVPAETDGSNVLGGSIDGVPFTSAMALWIESPDMESTTVIYLLSKPVRCLDLSFSDWDRHLPVGTTFLELKFFGHSPGTFWAVNAEIPAPEQVVVTYVKTFAGGTSNEIRASGGTVNLDAAAPRDSVSLNLSLAFGSHPLTGNVTALFCPGGHEP